MRHRKTSGRESKQEPNTEDRGATGSPGSGSCPRTTASPSECWLAGPLELAVSRPCYHPAGLEVPATFSKGQRALRRGEEMLQAAEPEARPTATLAGRTRGLRVRPGPAAWARIPAPHSWLCAPSWCFCSRICRLESTCGDAAGPEAARGGQRVAMRGLSQRAGLGPGPLCALPQQAAAHVQPLHLLKPDAPICSRNKPPRPTPATPALRSGRHSWDGAPSGRADSGALSERTAKPGCLGSFLET